MNRMLQSAPGPNGKPSARTFTPAEIAAAKRLKVVYSARDGGLIGPLFWAISDYWPEALRRVRTEAELDMKAAELLLAAVEREWHKEGAATEEEA